MRSVQSAWRWMLAGGACAVGTYFLLPGAGAKDAGYSLIGVISVAAVLVGIWAHRPQNRVAWYALAAGNLFFVFGDGVYGIYQFILHQAAPFPSLADVFYLGGYPFLVIGVVGLTRREGTVRVSREAYADAIIVTLGALAVSWHFLMASYAHEPVAGVLDKLVALAYPVMDIGVLFIVARGLLFSRVRSPVLRLLAAAMAAMLIGDFAYDLLVLHGAYATGNPVDATWLISYLLVGAAALHPSMSHRLVPPEPTSETDDARRLPVVALAGFVSPMIILFADLLGSDNDTAVMAAISIVLFGLVILRMRWLFARIVRQSASLTQALEERGSLEEELRHLAFHDGLTGLPNRALLHDRVERALAASSRRSTAVAVCFCDLDGFKAINDSLGHLAGDTILIAAGKRLSAAVRPGDTVARLGGDEFAVLMDDIEDPAVALAVAERIVSVLHEPVEINGLRVGLSVSVGLAVATIGVDGEQLLSEADSAMYEAKGAGKNRFVVFEQSMHARIAERLVLSTAFDGAILRNEFFLLYQPQYSLRGGQLVGFEALIRWNHPTLGIISPERFIPIAEDTGHIIPIGRWAIEQACEQAAALTASGENASLTMAVNLSALQLRDPRLVDDIRTAISLGGLDPTQLVVEITEGILIADTERNIQVLVDLKALGVRLSIDDFGTGYSSLSYLRRMPIDELKIDKSFVDPLIDPDGEGVAFVKTIITLAHTLGLKVIAEGVERRDQRDLLQSLDCDNAQGYLWARPLDREHAMAFISAARQ